MTLSRRTGAVGHTTFSRLPSLLRRGDLVVVNDTRVIRGRLRTVRSGGGSVEVFLLSRAGEAGSGEERWDALARPSKRLREGEEFGFGGKLRVRLERRRGGGRWEVSLSARGGSVAGAVEEAGEVPLPPYIRRSSGDPLAAQDPVRYQTVYADRPGSVAAPTAGLHFDEAMMAELDSAGIGIARLTLSVGYGTFSPIRTDTVEEYDIHPERYRLTLEAADRINAARAGAVGSWQSAPPASGRWSVRGEDRTVAPSEAGCSSARVPVPDGGRAAHQLPPRSASSRWAWRLPVRAAYRAAVEERYRFYSYGDAMLIS
jgi:S-adenosylmethionine:tRNA ribosyltransferase-isomerase